MYLHFGPSIKSQGNTPWKRPKKKKFLLFYFKDTEKIFSEISLKLSIISKDDHQISKN